jgi:hypothetical protein
MTINTSTQWLRVRAQNSARHGARTLITGILCFTASIQAASSANLIPNLSDWRENIAKVTPVGEGCFTAAYPKMQWDRITCGPTPKTILAPAAGATPATVGDGNDYVASVSGLMSSSTGTFPVTKHVKTEYDSGLGLLDTYSLQLNSQTFSGSPACAGAAVPANCKAWQQFTFNNEGTGPNPFADVTMQYWLQDYAPAKCPKGWKSFKPDCVKNSKTVYLGLPQPTIAFEYISDLTLTATATAGGNDKVVLVTKAQAYAVSAKDSIVELGQFWNATEFNAFGIGYGSDAMINAGASIKVNLAVKDSTGTAPTCVGNAGTTGEGNNLTLGSCSTVGNSIQFTESN